MVAPAAVTSSSSFCPQACFPLSTPSSCRYKCLRLSTGWQVSSESLISFFSDSCVVSAVCGGMNTSMDSYLSDLRRQEGQCTKIEHESISTIPQANRHAHEGERDLHNVPNLEQGQAVGCVPCGNVSARVIARSSPLTFAFPSPSLKACSIRRSCPGLE